MAEKKTETWYRFKEGEDYKNIPDDLMSDNPLFLICILFKKTFFYSV